MKKLALLFPVIAVLVILASGLPILAHPRQTPHENPSAAKSSLDGTAIMLSYANVFTLASASRYRDAQDVISELKQIDIPDELSYIIERYNTLSENLLTTLDTLEVLLNEAATLLSRQQVSQAEQRLNQAKAAITEAQALLEDVEAATDTLNNRLSVLTVSVPSQLKQSHDRLKSILLRLRQLNEQRSQLLQNLSERSAIQAKELRPTELSLNAFPMPAFVGDSVAIRGRLTSLDSPLPGRVLNILVGSRLAAVSADPAGARIPYKMTVTTGADGSYATEIKLPYIYANDTTLTVEYVPASDDAGKYQGAQSQPVTVLAYPGLLGVSAPETAHPGLPVNISGIVHSSGGYPKRVIKVFLDDAQVAEETAWYYFSFPITPPPQTSSGEHNLTVTASAEGRYSPVVTRRTIYVSKLPIQTDIQTPPLVITPGLIKVSGKLYHEFGPVQDARIDLNLKNSLTTAMTSADGSFTAYLKAPLDLFSIGPGELTVNIEIDQPWQDSLEVKKQIFIINPLNTGLMLAVLVSLGLVMYRRSRIRPQEALATPQPQVKEPPAVILTPKPKPRLTGAKGRILLAYATSLEAISEKLGITVAPHTTLREFLQAAASLPPDALKPFAELTAIAEVALYSDQKPDEGMAARAEHLAATTQKELHREPA